MNIYVTGANGHIGKQMIRLGCRPLACDITDLSSIEKALDGCILKPDVVINLAGKSNVDWCEKEENKELAIKTNLRGAYNVSVLCQERKIAVIQISSDHIFDGKNGPYNERSIRGLVPANLYGMTKMAMEGICDLPNTKIVRTSYLFDSDRIQSIMDMIEAGEAFPSFMRRSFMYSKHFVRSLYTYANRVLSLPMRIMHISASETMSWYEFALVVASVNHIDKELVTPRNRPLKDFEGAPRPRRAGLITKLSELNSIPQFSIYDGVHQEYRDKRITQLGFEE